MAEKGCCRLDQHLGSGIGRFEGLTPDRARALACSTVLIALRRGEVLNGRERGLEKGFLKEQKVGEYAAGSRKHRVLEIALWRLMSTKRVLEKLEALGHRKDIVEICICRFKNLRASRYLSQ